MASQTDPPQPPPINLISHIIPVSRQLMIDAGLIEPTPEEFDLMRMFEVNAHRNRWKHRRRAFLELFGRGNYQRNRVRERIALKIAPWIWPEE